jgi:hypothetical protein
MQQAIVISDAPLTSPLPHLEGIDAIYLTLSAWSGKVAAQERVPDRRQMHVLIRGAARGKPVITVGARARDALNHDGPALIPSSVGRIPWLSLERYCVSAYPNRGSYTGPVLVLPHPNDVTWRRKKYMVKAEEVIPWFLNHYNIRRRDD